MRRAWSRGFTLLEIVLVVVVLGIVAAIALPPVGRAMIAASVQNARHVVISTISLARASAMRYGRPVVLRLDSGGERVWAEADTTLSGTGTAIDTIGLFYLEADLNVDLEANRSAICFDARGVGTTSTDCPVAGARIILSRDDRADTISVSPLGRVMQ